MLTSPLALACSLPRALSGRLRLGLAEQSVLAALAQAVSLTPPGQGEAPRLSPPGARVSPGCPPFPKSTPQLLSRPLPSLAALSPAPPALGEPRGRAHPKASAGGSGLRFPPGCCGRWEGPDSRGPEDVAGGTGHDPEADVLVRSGAKGRGGVGGKLEGREARHRGLLATWEGPVASER